MAKVTRKPREIIEEKLLVSLTEEDKVAIVLDKEGLDLLISACNLQMVQKAICSDEERLKSELRKLLIDMKQLREQAFR